MTYPPGSRVRPLGKVPVQVLWHPVRPGITGTQAKRYVNPQANLDALNGVEKEEPEPLIEHVEIEDLSEIRPRPEALQHLIARRMVGREPDLVERIPVATQPVIADTLQGAGGFCRIAHDHAARLQQGNLSWDVEIRFVERNRHQGGQNENRPVHPEGRRGTGRVETNIGEIEKIRKILCNPPSKPRASLKMASPRKAGMAGARRDLIRGT